MTKKSIICIFIFIILSIFVTSETSMNFLTKGFADTLYCSINGDCINYTLINQSIDLRSNGTGVYVPYSGANDNVELGSYTIEASNFIGGGVTSGIDPGHTHTGSSVELNSSYYDTYNITKYLEDVYNTTLVEVWI